MQAFQRAVCLQPASGKKYASCLVTIFFRKIFFCLHFASLHHMHPHLKLRMLATPFIVCTGLFLRSSALLIVTAIMAKIATFHKINFDTNFVKWLQNNMLSWISSLVIIKLNLELKLSLWLRKHSRNFTNFTEKYMLLNALK